MRKGKHFGILGHSAEGAALCFQTFCRTGFEQIGAHQHPDVTVNCIAMGESMPAWDSEDHFAIRAILAESISRLARSGAEFFACPDNTAHMALEVPGAPFPIPGLHIAEVVASEAVEQRMKCIAVLGTKYTMQGPVYQRTLSTRGISTQVPTMNEQAEINRIIFEELVEGRFERESRDYYARVIDDLRLRGCDGVALVCTEIPLLITPDDSTLPTLDSTRLLAKAALEVSIGKRSIPTWYGGPVGRA